VSEHSHSGDSLSASGAKLQDRPGERKMDATDLLSAGIAHDFNNLLTIINGYSEMLLTSCELPEKAQQCLTVVRTAGERAASLARALMALTRRAPLESRIVDVNESVEELVALAQHLVPANIELSAVLSPDLSRCLRTRAVFCRFS
jgi:two-component system, cell cycle sensor histidine kinase and response regulator CckA